MINILNYLPPEANLSISLEQYQTFLEIAKQQERERIIKLLEAERWKLPNGLAAGGEIYLPIEEAIALIKGEQQ